MQGPLRVMLFSKNTPFGGITRVGVSCDPHVSFHALRKAYKNSKSEKKNLNICQISNVYQDINHKFFLKLKCHFSLSIKLIKFRHRKKKNTEKNTPESSYLPSP